MQKKQNKWKWTKKHHDQIWQAMRRILESEPYDKTLNDAQLTAAIRAQGVFTTRATTNAVRAEHKIGSKDERRVTQFAKQYKGGR